MYNPAFGTLPTNSPGHGTTTTITTITDREQSLLRGMTKPQLDLVAGLYERVQAGELEKRAMMAKGVEAAETVGTAGACGFLRGYKPDFMPLGFNPSLLVGLGGHGAAMYCAQEGMTKGDAAMLGYEPHLEHVGNGGLSAYAFEELREVGQRMAAAKAAKTAQQKAA